jgi:hypothetical protein
MSITLRNRKRSRSESSGNYSSNLADDQVITNKNNRIENRTSIRALNEKDEVIYLYIYMKNIRRLKLKFIFK